MNFYKKLIRSKKIRFKILTLLGFLPDEMMLKIQYFIKHHRMLNIKNPQRYTEKIQWYKLYYRDERMAICADKYKVREYVKEKGLEHILNDIYEVFDSIDSISFEKLPDQFVLKLSNGSSTNLICKNKNEYQLEEVRKVFEDYLFQANASAGREWVYKNKKPVVIAEKLLEDVTNKNHSINDYKIFCFNGTPAFIACDVNRHSDHKRNVYGIDWNNMGFSMNGLKVTSDELKKPNNLAEMLNIAEILSKDFPFVRVDLYSIQDRIFFGELTFFPSSGYTYFDPDEFDYKFGELFLLPERNN